MKLAAKEIARVLAGLFLAGTVAEGSLAGSAENGVNDEALRRFSRIPLGLPEVPVPADNQPTAEKIELGRKLFFDRRLSFNSTMSCGMCHVPEQGFTNNELATPVGVEGRSLRRNAPTILNSAFLEDIFQDGREISLENQPLSPLLSRDEMANPSIGWLIRKIEGLDDYGGLFEKAFGGGPTPERIGEAIASWERSMVAGDSPFDRWRYGGDEGALTAEQRAGFELFTGRAGCVSCHPIGPQSALFTDHSYHDTGIGYLGSEGTPRSSGTVPVQIAPGVTFPVDREVVESVGNERPVDLGRFEVTLHKSDMYRFRTPSLRNVAVTAPYMHNGSLATLDDVIRFYDRGGVPHPGLDPLIKPLDLTESEIESLASFLESLTSPDLRALEADARSASVGN